MGACGVCEQLPHSDRLHNSSLHLAPLWMQPGEGAVCVHFAGQDASGVSARVRQAPCSSPLSLLRCVPG
eukprot:12787990-Alexandrium_andersonii.AAC.1